MLDDPDLRGRPVIVGGLGNRGVVASASYEARQHGVHSAMPMARARRLCRDGVYVAPRLKRYRELSSAVFAVYRRWSERLEPLSLDEAYVDVSERCAEHDADVGGQRDRGREPQAVSIAHEVKQAVLRETGLTVSAGVSYNKFLAKLASAHDKPDGLTYIDASMARRFLAPLPPRKLWGVGPATAQRLADAGYATIGDIAAAEEDHLVALVGKLGHRIRRFAVGEDDRVVRPPGNPKSISGETTFDDDIVSWEQAAPHIRRFAASIERSLTRRDLIARTVVLKIRYQDFRTITRSGTPGEPLARAEEVLAVARRLATGVELSKQRRIRLVGLGVSNIMTRARAAELSAAKPPDSPQLELFDGPSPPNR